MTSAAPPSRAVAIAGGKIVEIDILADPERLPDFDVTLLDD